MMDHPRLGEEEEEEEEKNILSKKNEDGHMNLQTMLTRLNTPLSHQLDQYSQGL